jgi:hypothetical protein
MHNPQSLQPFFPDTRLRYIAPTGKEFGGVFHEKGPCNRMILVGNSGIEYETLESFFALECGGTKEDPWEVCEFWKSWAWWKCKEMLATN